MLTIQDTIHKHLHEYDPDKKGYRHVPINATRTMYRVRIIARGTNFAETATVEAYRSSPYEHPPTEWRLIGETREAPHGATITTLSHAGEIISAHCPLTPPLKPSQIPGELAEHWSGYPMSLYSELPANSKQLLTQHAQQLDRIYSVEPELSTASLKWSAKQIAQIYDLSHRTERLAYSNTGQATR